MLTSAAYRRTRLGAPAAGLFPLQDVTVGKSKGPWAVRTCSLVLLFRERFSYYSPAGWRNHAGTVRRRAAAEDFVKYACLKTRLIAVVHCVRDACTLERYPVEEW